MPVILHDIESLLGLKPQQLPKHIAMIMDGNGRWAQWKNLPRIEGHRQGAKVVRKMVTECSKLGIGYLTLYSFSMENWKRPREEVEFLMQLCAEYLAHELPEMMSLEVKLRHLGRMTGLPESVQQRLTETMAATAGNKGLILSLALNYSSRVEITDAMQVIAQKIARKELSGEEVTETLIGDHLYTAGMPDPDLIIRTAGERRLSNFLLWQLAYTEFYVEKDCWPDFSEDHLHRAIQDYVQRERKFGAISTKL
ncbi:MAG: isoprenyl transferase [Phycisphaerae bacterium]